MKNGWKLRTEDRISEYVAIFDSGTSGLIAASTAAEVQARVTVARAIEKMLISSSPLQLRGPLHDAVHLSHGYHQNLVHTTYWDSFEQYLLRDSQSILFHRRWEPGGNLGHQ